MFLWGQEQFHRCCYWKWHLNCHTSLVFRSKVFLCTKPPVSHPFLCLDLLETWAIHGLCFLCFAVFECQSVYLIEWISTNALNTLYSFCFSFLILVTGVCRQHFRGDLFGSKVAIKETNSIEAQGLLKPSRAHGLWLGQQAQEGGRDGTMF